MARCGFIAGTVAIALTMQLANVAPAQAADKVSLKKTDSGDYECVINYDARDDALLERMNTAFAAVAADVQQGLMEEFPELRGQVAEVVAGNKSVYDFGEENSLAIERAGYAQSEAAWFIPGEIDKSVRSSTKMNQDAQRAEILEAMPLDIDEAQQFALEKFSLPGGSVGFHNETGPLQYEPTVERLPLSSQNMIKRFQEAVAQHPELIDIGDEISKQFGPLAFADCVSKIEDARQRDAEREAAEAAKKAEAERKAQAEREAAEAAKKAEAERKAQAEREAAAKTQANKPAVTPTEQAKPNAGGSSSGSSDGGWIFIILVLGGLIAGIQHMMKGLPMWPGIR